uniref:Uncharacterized protein n=2 Tax=Culex quinquefasciatus TaxID=7176 RepID=A0A1S4JSB1_CULQU
MSTSVCFRFRAHTTTAPFSAASIPKTPPQVLNLSQRLDFVSGGRLTPSQVEPAAFCTAEVKKVKAFPIPIREVAAVALSKTLAAGKTATTTFDLEHLQRHRKCQNFTQIAHTDDLACSRRWNRVEMALAVLMIARTSLRKRSKFDTTTGAGQHRWFTCRRSAPERARTEFCCCTMAIQPMFKNCVDAICDPSRLDFPSIKYIATASLQSMSVISEHTDENRDIIHA